MNYSCIGFDIRRWPCPGVLSSESSYWEQNFGVYEDIKKKFNLQENLYQLLEITDTNIFNSIKAMISSKIDCNFIAICIPTSIAVFNSEKSGYPVGYKTDLNEFSAVGVDIGDIDGFFSVLRHPKVQELRGTQELFSQNDFAQILEAIQFASFLDRNHAPYCAIKIMALKN